MKTRLCTGYQIWFSFLSLKRCRRIYGPGQFLKIHLGNVDDSYPWGLRHISGLEIKLTFQYIKPFLWCDVCVCMCVCLHSTKLLFWGKKKANQIMTKSISLCVELGIRKRFPSVYTVHWLPIPINIVSILRRSHWEQQLMDGVRNQVDSK